MNSLVYFVKYAQVERITFEKAYPLQKKCLQLPVTQCVALLNVVYSAVPSIPCPLLERNTERPAVCDGRAFNSMRRWAISWQARWGFQSASAPGR